MLRSKVLQSLVLLAGISSEALAQTWCGKHYKAGSSPSEPGGEFPVPGTSSSPLLALRCAQAIRPYIPGDANGSGDSTAVSVLIDAPVTFSKIANAAAVTIPSGSTPNLAVTVTVDGNTLTSGNVSLNSTKHALPFSLSSLTARKAPYEMTCTATLSGQTFKATGQLTYLPSPPSGIGSVTKMDLRTGAMLAKPANGNGGSFAPVFPIGFYTQWDGYLLDDPSVPATLAKQGFTVVHPVGEVSFDQLDTVLERMQEAGLYLMFDMRGSYQDSATVTSLVNHVKSRPNLLLWYTADEPDGTSDSHDATVTASNLITSLDGGDGKGGAGYHPVSLVLNCQDYFFNSYAAGADIVLQDTYMIGNNVTFSTVWGTPCNRTWGDCGCDNCQGKFEDISNRMDDFSDRLFANGWDRTKAVWAVPQGFGEETYWPRYPTGKEFVLESVLGINHGAMGVVSWDDPTSDDIKSSASALALAMPKMTPFILSPSASFKQVTISRVDFGLWTVGSKTLVLGTNMNTSNMNITFSQLGLPSSGSSSGISQVFDSGAASDAARGRFVFTGTGSGAWIFNV